MVYGDFEDVATRTASDKVLRDKAFHIAKYPKYDRNQRGLACMVYQLFDKKVSSSGISLCQVNNWQMNFISKFLKKFLKKVYTSFKDNIWGPDLADMHLVSKYNYA